MVKEVTPRSAVIRVTVRENWLFGLIDSMVGIRLELAVSTVGGEHLAFTRKKYTRLCEDLDAAILKVQKLVMDARSVSDQIYAESFRGEKHLDRIVEEAQAMVDKALRGMRNSRVPR